MPDDAWYYAAGAQQAGPVSFAVLQQMLAEGQLSPQDLVWRQGMIDWQAAASVPELASLIPPPAYPPQPAAYAPSAPDQPAAQPYYDAAPQGGYQQPLPYESHYADKFITSAHASRASTAFTLSIVGIFCGGAILGIIALALGCSALAGMNRTGNNTNKGYAIAAIVIGSLEALGGLAFIVALVGS